MSREYLTGELSVLLEKLASATRSAAARDVASLRYQVETKPAAWLTAEMTQALILADQVCWDSLSRGDVQAFDRQAVICAELRLFGTCAGLTDEE